MTLRKSLIATATVLAVGSCFADDGAYAHNSRQPVAVSLSAQNDQNAQGGARSMFRQGQDPLDESRGGYSAPARIDVNGKWDVNFNASFIYWNPYQDGMDVAVEADMNAARTDFSQTSGEIEFHKSGYKPGFKVGAGMSSADFDNWTFGFLYTWLHAKSHTSRSADTDIEGFDGEPWFSNQFNTVGRGISSEWDLHFQMADVFASRPYYSGRRLTVSPYGGLRAMWMRQEFDVGLKDILTLTAVPANPPRVADAVSANKQKSWSIGPLGGVNCNWLIGRGFRSIGNVSGGILYTRYTHVSNSQTLIDTTPVNQQSGPIGGKVQGHYNAVRPFLEFDLGLGFGTYCCDNDFYFDFQASYDFLMFFSQNMMRWNADRYSSNSGHSPGDFWMQGLTVTARFDF